MRADQRDVADLEAIEQRISQIDADFYRHPSSPVTISEEPDLPAELRYGKH